MDDKRTTAKQVIVFPTGTLTARDRSRLSRLGLVAIEAADPKQVVLLVPTAPALRGDDVLLAALQAVEKGNSNYGPDTPRAVFANTLIARIRKNTDSPRDNPTA